MKIAVALSLDAVSILLTDTQEIAFLDSTGQDLWAV